MKKVIQLVAVILLFTAVIPATGQAADKMAWWKEARFGMFIHWGVYSVFGNVYEGVNVSGEQIHYDRRTSGYPSEWIMRNAPIPRSIYREAALQFDAKDYDPKRWVEIAKYAGMKYIVITAKHHDGFCLFDTQYTTWDAVDASAAHRDLLQDLVKEAHDAGLKIGFYYSQNLDWMHEGGMDFIPELNGTYPADKVEKYVNELVIPHIQELTTKYDIDLFWFDAPGASNTNPTLAQKILDALLQSPVGNKVIYNDRLAPGFEGDFFTPENDTPDIPYNGYDHNKNWEACSSLNSSWGFEYEPDTYNAYNYTWKSGLYSISRILELASKGGNFLLNVGPDRHGVIPEPAVNTLKEIGDYMQLYGETVYGTQKNTLLNPFEYGYVTQKTDADGTFHWYLHVSPAYWNEKSIVVNGITELPENATLLATQELLPVTLENNNLLITLPEMDCPDQYYVPVELVFSQTPQQVSKSNIRNNQIRLTPFQASTRDLNKDFVPYTIKYWYGRNAEMRFRIYLEKGTYQLGAEYAAWYQPGELYFTINDASYTGHYQATGLASVPNDFSHYISDDLGGLSITIPKSQVYTLSVKRNAEVPNVTNWIYVRNFTLTKSGSDTGFNSSGVQIYPTVIRVTTDKYLYCKTFEVQTFRIYNSQGHCVKTFIADKQELKIDASNLPAGVYLVVGKRSLHKIIIE